MYRERFNQTEMLSLRTDTLTSCRGEHTSCSLAELARELATAGTAEDSASGAWKVGWDRHKTTAQLLYIHQTAQQHEVLTLPSAPDSRRSSASRSDRRMRVMLLISPDLRGRSFSRE